MKIKRNTRLSTFAYATTFSTLSIFITVAEAQEVKPDVPKIRTENQRNIEDLKDERLKKFTFIYPDDMKPADYLSSQPIMIGSWRFTSETKTHWIGNLHHPRENISAGSLFMEKDFQIKKDPKLKIDLRNGRYYLMLKLDKPVTMQVEKRLRKDRSMTLVGFLKARALGTFDNLHEDHPYKKKVVK